MYEDKCSEVTLRKKQMIIAMQQNCSDKDLKKIAAQSGQCNETDVKDNLHSTLRHINVHRKRERGEGKISTNINGSGKIGFTKHNTRKKDYPPSEETTPTTMHMEVREYVRLQ